MAFISFFVICFVSQLAQLLLLRIHCKNNNQINHSPLPRCFVLLLLFYDVWLSTQSKWSNRKNKNLNQEQHFFVDSETKWANTRKSFCLLESCEYLFSYCYICFIHTFFIAFFILQNKNNYPAAPKSTGATSIAKKQSAKIQKYSNWSHGSQNVCVNNKSTKQRVIGFIVFFCGHKLLFSLNLLLLLLLHALIFVIPFFVLFLILLLIFSCCLFSFQLLKKLK